MGKRIVRNADLLQKAQNLKYIVKGDAAPEQATQAPEQATPNPEQIIPTQEQIDDICPYVPSCHDNWNNKEWTDICTESDYKEFIEIIQPFCIKNPDLAGCDDCIL